ncbi:unnamed protein product [Symbiodinium natans]|uniref:Uncharacterized protein n=1 Tax=Symbiodinium natans TaxID=878477 RepID=A0A812Q655_9DINO|nr:unnamed protein product [Symbiodinium natans]
MEQGRQQHQDQCRQTRRLAKERVRQMYFGSLVLRCGSVWRHCRRLPAWQRFMLWCLAWLAFLQLADSGRSGGPPGFAVTGVASSVKASGPESAMLLGQSVTEQPQTSSYMQNTKGHEEDEEDEEDDEEDDEDDEEDDEDDDDDDEDEDEEGSGEEGQQEKLKVQDLDEVQRGVWKGSDAVSGETGVTGQEEAVPVFAPEAGPCVKATNSSTDVCCSTAVARIQRTSRFRSAYLQSPRDPSNIQSWWSQLAPSTARWYAQRAADEAAGQRWNGIAVLVVGQVRAGTEERVTRNIHKHVFQEMPTSRYHVFAVLEFTRSGFTWRGENQHNRNYSRDFADEQVQEMLSTYGGNYTLAEWTRDDVEREQYVYAECSNQAKAGQGLTQQYLKFARALELMSKKEEEDGQRFALVVRIRPDIMYVGSAGSALRYRLAEAMSPVNSTIPFACGSIGGGGGDAFLMMDRAAATALGNVWRSLRGCRVENVDECVSWPAILGACLARPGPQHLRHYVKEQCEHGWVPVFLRHGVPNTDCGVSGVFAEPPHR